MLSNALRRFALWGAAATLLAIASGGLVSATGSAASCAVWPVCTDNLFATPSLLAWLAFAHRLLVLAAMLLGLAVALAAAVARSVEPLARIPLIVTPLLGLAQVGAGAAMVQLRLFEAADLSHLVGALLVLACQVVPVAVLAQPRMADARLGARATREVRRLRATAWWAAGAVAVLTVALRARAGLGAGAAEATLLPANALGAVAMAGALSGGVLWQTLRRGDRLLLVIAALTLALVAVQSAMLLLPPALAGVGVGIGALALSAALALAVLLPRRPAMSYGPGRQSDATQAALAVSARPARPSWVSRGGSVRAAHSEQSATPSLLADYISLTKPKVISLLLVTTLAAMYITEAGFPSLWLVFWTMLGGYLAAGGAGAINCAFDHDIDVNMGRTSRRPVPSGRISRGRAMAFGLLLSALSVMVMLVFTTPLAAFFSTLGIVYYALFYTRWLKRSTWQNIVIGGGAGSIPPLVGWTAVTGDLSLAAVVLFAIVFYWTPPHFWALALVKQKDYARAGVPMLPVVAGEGETRWQILVYSAMLVALSTLLTAIGAMGWIYLVAALLLGALFLHYAWRTWRVGDQTAIWGLYKYSLLYLALLFAAMVVDRSLL
jgi:protoheme IX farnesyltransferase